MTTAPTPQTASPSRIPFPEIERCDAHHERQLLVSLGLFDQPTIGLGGVRWLALWDKPTVDALADLFARLACPVRAETRRAVTSHTDATGGER